MKKLYVGNLPFSATEDQIRALFSKHTVVHSVSLVNDRETGRFQGYGTVEIDDIGFEKALKLDGAAMDGRPLKVHEITDEPVPNEGDGGDTGDLPASDNTEASGS